MTTLVLLHSCVGGTGSVGKRVRLLALNSRNAELAGGLSSNPILSGLRRTMNDLRDKYFLGVMIYKFFLDNLGVNNITEY
jgi:hypothetical protein